MTVSHVAEPADALRYLSTAVGLIEQPNLRCLAQYPLLDQRFAEAPASSSKHHCFVGGLVVHTAEVLMFARGMTDVIPQVLEPRLDAFVTTAVIWHDYAKIFDYVVEDDGIHKTPHAAFIGHLPRSYAEMTKVARQCFVLQSDVDILAHLMLAHHGRKTWGSPVEPQTLAAWIIHAADMASAHFLQDVNHPPLL